MKQLIAIILLAVAAITAKAQSNTSQTVSMTATNTVECAFTANGTGTGPTVNLGFASVNDYANGVTSPDQQLTVSSNQNFTVAVKTSAANFTYTGTTSPAPVMPVNGTLALMVSANSTGGNIASGFSGYSMLTGSNQNIITSGNAGNAKLFSIKYKATPGFAYPAGTYTVNVIFTISQQ